MFVEFYRGWKPLLLGSAATSSIGTISRDPDGDCRFAALLAMTEVVVLLAMTEVVVLLAITAV